MKQQLLVQPGRFVLQEVPDPSPGAHEVVLRVERVGICGSDLHIYRDQSFIKPPVVLGHEFAGVVVALGVGVTGVASGDRVAVNPGVNCGECAHCLAGLANVCERQLCIGACAEWPGAFAEFVRVPAANLIPLPDHLSFAAAALIEPAAVAMHALDKAQVTREGGVVVLGLGTVGQLVAQACRLAGACCVIAVDPLPGRRQLSVRLGVHAAFDPTAITPEAIVQEHFGGRGADFVFDTASNPQSFAFALRLLRRGGRYVDVGEAVQPITFDLNALAFYEIELTGVNMYRDCNFSDALTAIAEGRMLVEPLVSAVYGLADVQAGFTAAADAPDCHVKVLLAP